MTWGQLKAAAGDISDDTEVVLFDSVSALTFCGNQIGTEIDTHEGVTTFNIAYDADEQP